ncbi:MAG: anthranilate phosphoribosyltransferase [Nitrospirales bacterium]
MERFIAKIGKGQKAWKDLTWEEAKEAMRLLIEQRATPVQVGAFLAAMRIKVESVTELAAFTAAARTYVPPVPVPVPVVDLPTYGAKRETFHALVGAAVIAAAGGAAVLLHGHEGEAGRRNAATLLHHLHVPTDLAAQGAAEQVGAHGIAYLDIALYHPPIAKHLELSRELGLRTLFHGVARLLNPARARTQVLGLAHPPYLEKSSEALGMLGGPRALILLGVEGEPELSIAAPTRLVERQGDRVEPMLLRPMDLGFAPGTRRDMAAPADEAALLTRILGNQIPGGPRDWVLMNAALLLYAAGRAPSIRAAVPLVRQILESGAAARKLRDLASAQASPASRTQPGAEAAPARESAA